MAFLGYSDDFDLDDDGILRDSTEFGPEEGDNWMDYISDKDTGGILIDDDGIVRDDFDLLSKHGSSTHWTDSGLGGDKPASTPSTLRQLDLQSYPSFEDVSRNFDESNVNISDLEASKDDLSFDDDYDEGRSRDRDFFDESALHSKGNRSGLSSRSSFDHSLNYDDSVGNKDVRDPQSDLFGEEYYRQLQELGVLVDEGDFANPRESLQEFESLEHHYSREFEDEDKPDPDLEHILRQTGKNNIRDSMDIDMPDDRNDSKSGYFEDSRGFDHFYNREFVNEGERRTRPNTASSTRTISSRSFPEISPEEALELYGERRGSTDGESLSIQFDVSQSQRTDPLHHDQQVSRDEQDEDEIYFVPSQDQDADSPKPPKIPAYDIENKPSMTPKRSRLDRSRSDRSSEGSRSVTPQSQSQYTEPQESDNSRSLTPQPVEEHGYHSNEDRNDSLTQVTRLDSRRDIHSESDHYRPDSALSERSSAASEGRGFRSKTQKVTNKPPKSTLAHAKSEQSFFDMENMTLKKVEKGPKRLLPKPTPGEENQSFKVKSKSTTNIAALGGPVKPTHMSLSEIRNIAIDDDFELHEQSEPKSQASDVPKGELTKKLKQESSKRQQATQLVKQLQEDYDKLLSKYALAELTIDQMRLGSKITIHANSPTPSQATSGSLQSAQHLQLLQLSNAQRGVMAPSPQQATPTMFFPESFVPPEDGRQVQQRGTSPTRLPRSDSVNSMDSTSTPRGEVEQPGGIANDAEKVKLGLLFQARNLDERMQSFQSLLGENQLNIEEQEGVFDKIRTDHEKLRSDYLQSKEDYNVLRRSTPAAADLNFDQEKELEGELFKLGMKFDEIQENVDENMKQKSSARQPFQKKRRESTDSLAESLEPDPSTENMKRKLQEVKAGDDLLQPRTEPEFDKKLKQMHDEYNALMDRYKRLKDMAHSKDRDREIDNLVKKLTKISNEEPDVFKLPPDVKDRADQLQAAKASRAEKMSMSSTKSAEPGSDLKSPSKSSSHDKRRLPDPNASKSGSTKSPAKSYEILTASETWSLAESIDRWERTKQQDKDGHNISRSSLDLNTSLGSSRSFRNDYDRPSSGKRSHDDGGSGLKSKDRSNSYTSLSSRGRHTPDSGRGRHSPESGRGRHTPESGRGRHTPESGRGRHSPESGRGRYTPDSSYNDRDSPVPSLPRPRRHDYPDRERRERRDLKKSPDMLGESTTSSLATDSGIASLYAPKFRNKKPDGGSTTSLQDSGISEHEGGATGGLSGPNSPLSKLPGPGKFKQMTGRREADTDSGFIGSMVGSEVSAGNLSSRRQPQQSSLRLRHPGDPPSRPSSRQSNRSDDSARVTTPRSGRSQASSKSSRRTPTKAFPLPETRQETRSETRTKTPTRDGNRSKSRDQNTQHSRDYTDDSYTTVTESEVSFDSDMRVRRRHSLGSRHNTSQRQIDKIAEDSEEEQFSVDPTLNETTDINLSWVTSDTERPSVKQSKRQEPSQQTLKKGQETPSQGAKRPGQSKTQVRGQQSQGQGRTRQGRSSRQTTDDESLSTLSPTRDTTRETTQDTTEDTYTSDESTPRSVIERERKANKSKSPGTGQKTEVKRRGSTGQEIPPPRTVTPLKVTRSEVHPKKLYRDQEQGPIIKAPERSDLNTAPKYHDRSIGSAVDDTILASDAETAATRGSVNSQRLKLLTDEIEKLRAEFVKANNEKQQAPPPPPPPQQPPQQQQPNYYDQYFDPTEDPLAFMRGPRRRANSFSGHGETDRSFSPERNWDYDWMYGANRDGDIPLGYAAADAYATPRQQQQQQAEEQAVEEDPTRSRGRRRLRRRIHQRNAGTHPIPQQNGYDSDQSPTRGTREEAGVQAAGHYGYYPQQTTQSPVQQAHTEGMQQGRHVYGSQPNLQYFGYQPPPQQAQSVETGSTKSSSSRPLRQSLYSYAANPNQTRVPSHPQPSSQRQFHHRPYSNDDIHVHDGQTRFVPTGAAEIGSDGFVRQSQGVYTSTCPMCGSTSSHTHGEFVFPPPDASQPVGYLVHDGRDVVESVLVPVFAQPDTSVRPEPIIAPPPHLSPSPQYRPSVLPTPIQPPAQYPYHAFGPLSVMRSQLAPPPLVAPPPPVAPPHMFAPPHLSTPLPFSAPPPPVAPPPTKPPQYFQAVVASQAQTETDNSPLPFRVYKAPPKIKPRFFSFRLPDKIRFPVKRAVSNVSAPRPQPVAANHNITPQPFLKLLETTKYQGHQPRARSRSWGRTGRIRHYSPDGRMRSRYFVREFGDVESDSAESETEEMPIRRSRSTGRRKHRHGRKYKRVHAEEDMDTDRGMSSRLPKPKTELKNEIDKQLDTQKESKGDNPEHKSSAAAVDDLDRSLRLVDEIDHLTHKMMGTVGSELAKSKRTKDFGSSYW